MVFYNFLNFFAISFEFSITGRVGIDRNKYFLFSLFLSISQPVLAWREALPVFYNVFNFFAIFLKFSIIGQERIDRNDNFCFLSFSAFPNLFCLEEKP